jgi:hypothetical protein
MRTLSLLLALTPPLQAQYPNVPRLAVTTLPTLGADRDWTHLAGAALLPNGQVMVAERTIPEVVLFDPAGVARWSFGERGGGPGEFRALTLTRCADGTVLVWDAGLARFTVIDTTGSYDLVSHPNGASLLFSGCNGLRDTYWSHRNAGASPPPSETWFVGEATFLRQHRGRVDTLGTGRTRYWFGVNMSTDDPLGERAYPITGGGVAYLCQAGSGSCTSHRANGITHTFTVNLPTPRVTDEDWRHANADRERRASVVFNPNTRDRFVRLFQSQPRPQRFGRFEEAAVDDQGQLWVKSYYRYGQPTARWFIYSPLGAPLYQVDMPAGWRPLGFSGSHVVGETLNDDDVPVVRQYELRPH